MPDLQANIPQHIFYGSFLAEVLRIARATLLYEDFLPRAKEIYNRMQNQGGSTKILNREIRKLAGRYPNILTKFRKTSTNFLYEISQ